MYKKVLALCLSVVLAMSTAIMPIFADNSEKKDNHKQNTVQKHFTDSDLVDWAEKSIEKLGAMGVLNGMGNGLFKPSNNVTHAEAIAMMLKLKGEKAQAEAITSQPSYFDGLCDAWSFGYLQLALDEGIIIPREDGKFNPKTPAKRYEVAKYIVRALGKTEDAQDHMNARLNFNDANAIPKSAIGYVYVINELGIMKGSNNVFQPNKPITRAEMAVLLDRAANGFDDSVVNDNSREGVFVAYNKTNSTLTLNINNTQVVYKVNSYTPVYRNNTYYVLDTLKAGDVIEIVLDSSNTIIFIEFKEDGTIPTTGQQLSIQHIGFSNLPAELQSRINTLKLTKNYAAFRNGNYIYLIATRGKLPSGGYTITMTNVYRETVQTGKYNLKAIVEEANPSNSVVTQSVTYPYDIVRLPYFDGIDKINFYDDSNNLLRQTTLNALDAIEVINGTINSINARQRIIYLRESDNVVRSYYIPSDVQITLDNRAVAISSLTVNMQLAITKTNGEITSLAAQTTNDTVVLITGVINSVDTSNRIIYIKEADNVVRPYYIASSVKITLNGGAVALSALEEDMTATLTRTNGIITSIAAANANTVETVSGKIDSVDVQNRIVYLKESDNVVRSYFIPSNVQITLDNRAVALSALTANMNLTITKTNDIITKLAAQTVNSVETINGKINSVDASNRIVYIKESDNVVRPYYIPTNVRITLNNTAVAITALTENMTVALTRTNGIITRLAATQTVQTINGKISSIEISSSTVKLQENNNVVNSYVIPANVIITLNNQTATLANLTQGMSAAITKVDGIITKLAVQNNIQLVEGILVSVYPSTNNSTINVKVGSTYQQFVIIPETAVFLNNQSISIQQMPINAPITIRIVNGTVTEVRNR